MEKLKKDIGTIKIGKSTIQKLRDIGINNILELCSFSRIELAKKEITNKQINEIMIALQLIGLNLKANHAKKNNLIKNQ